MTAAEVFKQTAFKQTNARDAANVGK